LATCLSIQFEIYGDISLLDECISIARKVLDSRPHGHPLRDCSMNNLSNYLRDRHYHLGDVKALEERQRLVIKALELCPPGHPRRGRRLHAYGTDLHEEYTRSGDVALLDEAASVLQESATLAVTAAPYNRSLTLSVLGNILRCRYQHLGDVTSLDRSSEVFAEALSLCPPGHYGRNFHLANYATVLRTHFTQSGDITALDCATKYLEEALELCPAGHQLRESTVKLFASVLCDRDLLTGDVVALNTAIDYFRESLVLRPPGRDIRPEALTDLASALYQSYQANGNPELIDEAIELYIEAIESRQTEHNVRHTALISLALLYLNPSCFRHDTHLAFEYLLNMVKHTDGSPRSRLIAARKFLGHAQELYYSGQIRSQGDMKLQNLILTVYQETVALLPVVANFSLDLSSRLRESALSQILGCAGATFALECGQKAIALEILEEARSIFWCQGLRLRDTQFNDLPIELAIQLEELFKALSQWPETPLQSEISTSYHNEDHAFRRRQNETVHQLLQDVRKLRGFERFLLGQQFSSLTQAACKGPVVVLISDQFRCNALILLNKNGETRHVPLSLLTPHSLKGLSVRSRALHTTRGNERSILSDSVGRAVRIRRKGKWEDGEHILEELWMKVVKPIINALGLQVSLVFNLQHRCL
jgi:tetratricopeptide (TPR) repeat protein